MPDDKHKGATLSLILRIAFFLVMQGLVSSLPASAKSRDVEPFHVRNMNPFVQVYGLPTATSSSLLTESESYLQLTADVANNSVQSTSDSELIKLDGETYRLAFIWKRGLGSDWQIGIEIPYLSHNAGVMDGLIENWHDFFGLSNSSREDWPRNRLLYRYDNEEGQQLLIDHASAGPGDMVISLDHALRLNDDSNRGLALHASLKLPTGDSEALLGSGAADVAFWLSASEEHKLWRWPVNVYGQGGVLLKGKGDLLPAQQRNLVLFGSFGVGWRPLEWIDLKAQIDGNTPHFHSKLDQLGGQALLLTLGGSIHLDGDIQRIDISFGENLTSDSVPDFMINLSYVHSFGSKL
jgi:hypothetical protein